MTNRIRENQQNYECITNLLFKNPGVTLDDLASENYKERCKLPILKSTHKQAKKVYRELYKTKKYTASRLYQRVYYQRIRLDVLKHYGGEYPCCELLEKYPDTCGADCIELLTIDHENGSGLSQHKEIKRNNFYYWLKKNNYPDGYIDKYGIFHKFRLLCHNCNHLERLRIQRKKDIDLICKKYKKRKNKKKNYVKKVP